LHITLTFAIITAEVKVLIDFYEELDNFKPVAEPDDFAEDDPAAITDLAEVLFEITKTLRGRP
jgi:hypothetical protein